MQPARCYGRKAPPKTLTSATFSETKRSRAWTGKRTQQSPITRDAPPIFYVVVKGINCGKFNLKLSHNTRTDTATYEQKNAMTQVHWAGAHDVIAKRDLLGRTMSLYRKEGTPPEFLIEID